MHLVTAYPKIDPRAINFAMPSHAPGLATAIARVIASQHDLERADKLDLRPDLREEIRMQKLDELVALYRVGDALGLNFAVLRRAL